MLENENSILLLLLVTKEPLKTKVLKTEILKTKLPFTEVFGYSLRNFHNSTDLFQSTTVITEH